MKILHLSDFHYNSKSYSKFSNDQIINKLSRQLENEKGKIDLVLFSGDITFNGKSKSDFDEANKALFERLIDSLDITARDIIFCAGNHDYNRKYKLPSLEMLFNEKVIDSDRLYDFVKCRDQDYENSLKGISSYIEFAKEYYDDLDIVEDLYSIHKRVIDEKKVGILTINSGWRAVDDNCKGRLMFPIYQLEQALTRMDDCDNRLFMVHHPLFWFKEFNYHELQEIVHKNFNIIFSGHVHDSQITSHYKYSNGIFDHVAPASMTYEKNNLGYSIIDYDIQTNDKAIIQEAKYDKSFGKFTYDEKVVMTIPVGEAKAYQNSIREKINSKFNLELSYANDLLLDKSATEKDEYSFINLFNSPILKSKSKTQINIEDSPLLNQFEEVINPKKSFLVFGGDKSGKSSLLKYINLTHLQKFSVNGVIPFYIDFKEINEKASSDWDMVKEMSRYFELSKSKTVKLIKEHNFRLLIDNFDPHSILFEKVNDFLLEFPETTFIVCSYNFTSREVDEYEFAGKDYQKLYLHDISRNEVRTYAEKCLKKSVQKKDAVIEKLVGFCKQLEMPINYWTISILLLIHKKSQFDLSKNTFEILDLCVDEILEKKKLGISKSRITFNQLKLLGGQLAKELLTEYHKDNYSTSYSNILDFINLKIDENIRLTADGQEILDFFLSSGLLRKKEDGRISFRLNGIFEYFIAYHMSNNKKVVGEIISQDEIYLSFKNEFEIYSGLKTNDESFLKRIFNKTKDYFNEINSEFKKEGRPDELLVKYITQDYDSKLDELTKELISDKPLSEEDKDIIRDQIDPIQISQEIKRKRIYNVDELDSEIFERYVSILARVYRTMDNINNPEFIVHDKKINN